MGYADKDEFHHKYKTLRRDTGEELDPDTTFTLVPERDPHAVKAIAAYADSVEHELPQLAQELRERFVKPNE